jgi:hypothetical protein
LSLRLFADCPLFFPPEVNEHDDRDDREQNQARTFGDRAARRVNAARR